MGPGELDFRQEGFMLPKGGNDGSFCKADFICLLAVLGLCCCSGFLQLQQAGGTLEVRCAGFPLRRLLLLQSTGSRLTGSVVVAPWALEHRLSSCGSLDSRAQTQ